MDWVNSNIKQQLSKPQLQHSTTAYSAQNTSVSTNLHSYNIFFTFLTLLADWQEGHQDCKNCSRSSWRFPTDNYLGIGECCL